MPKAVRKADITKQNFGIRRRILAASFFATALVIGCGGWAAHANLSSAIVSRGKVAVKRQVKDVQHRDGGIVGAILVDNGDKVKAGDVIVRLDDTQTRAELGVIRAQMAELFGRRARLIAECNGEDTVAFDATANQNGASSAIVEGERRLFEANRATRDAQREQLKSQIAQYEEQVRGLKAQLDSNAIERKIVADDLSRLAPLVKRKLVESAKTRAMERDLARADGLDGEIGSNIARVKGQISETRLKVIELDQKTRTDAQRELRDVDGRISELKERAVAASDRLSRMEITAPITGTVNDLKIHTVGGVITSGETLMTVVPDGADMVVEAHLAPSDIDQIAIGQKARLRFSAFNQRTTPEIAGIVETVGAAATLDPATGQTFYLSTIAITDIARIGDKHLIPGMPVDVFLTTGERSALSFLVKPFTDQMQKAMREN